MNIVHMSITRDAVADVLERARQLLAGGWNGPYSLDAAGQICTAEDEGISRFCFDDALLVSARYDAALAGAAERLVEVAGGFFGVEQAQRVCAGDFLTSRRLHAVTLASWLSDDARTQAEVLRLVAQAAARARAEAGVDTYRPEASL